VPHGVVTGALDGHDARRLCQPAPGVRCASFVRCRGVGGHGTRWSLNGWILLVILFPCHTDAVTVSDSPCSWACNDGNCEAKFSAL
jgi:hypothetical protein